MSQPEYNPPAFPRPAGENVRFVNDAESGMTLRDWFAGQALAGMRFSVSDDAIYPAPQAASDWAYTVADSMLAERAKPIGGSA